ncbi:MAG: biotin--[acetyl-CoA-carboxylase] ligase [Treponema sp.]|jgi:BirA family biotin operon repressor/biotin-[acetyl-CoA-carboxylase] ligase|nr:biotin--[acetyl-CoA-carboxylase] ligase [Treponema sp.]
MNRLALSTPFDAPVYHRETVASTMDESRLLAAQGAPHGTVIAADFQEQGRGRTGRSWYMADRGQNLSFTILLRYGSIEAIPQAITLKAGLAVSYAVEDVAPALRGRLSVKWPNDIMIEDKKAAGILAESDGQTVYLGIGVNVGQTLFPPELERKAISIAMAIGASLSPFPLLEKILTRLYPVLGAPPRAQAPRAQALKAPAPKAPASWRQALEARLYKRGAFVRFAQGAADSGRILEGRLTGIGPGGELLLLRQGAAESEAFTTGELLVY